jgi:hypothetical protein
MEFPDDANSERVVLKTLNRILLVLGVVTVIGYSQSMYLFAMHGRYSTLALVVVLCALTMLWLWLSIRATQTGNGTGMAWLKAFLIIQVLGGLYTGFWVLHLGGFLYVSVSGWLVTAVSVVRLASGSIALAWITMEPFASSYKEVKERRLSFARLPR